MIVPKSGGTLPYASIHRTREDLDVEYKQDDQQQQHQQQLKAADAKKNKNTKTHEELTIENANLKKLTDDLSRRLYNWEKTAQHQGQALQQSMRLLPPGSRPGSDGGDQDIGTGAGGGDRVTMLEEQVKGMKREIESLRRENEKLKTVVARYRERWEKLKEGARRREGGEKGANAP